MDAEDGNQLNGSPLEEATVIEATVIEVIDDDTSKSDSPHDEEDAQDYADALWTMANDATHIPEVFESLCVMAGEKVRYLNVPDIARVLWAMAKTGTHAGTVG